MKLLTKRRASEQIAKLQQRIRDLREAGKAPVAVGTILGSYRGVHGFFAAKIVDGDLRIAQDDQHLMFPTQSAAVAYAKTLKHNVIAYGPGHPYAMGSGEPASTTGWFSARGRWSKADFRDEHGKPLPAGFRKK